MENTKRNPALIAIGISLIAIGVIVFIVSCVQLYNIQHTESRWIEGFMQDYQARTNAENSIPCYIFMALSALMVIAGIIMLVIKPRNTITVQNHYLPPMQPPVINNVNKNEINYCPRCGSKIESNSRFCTKCGLKLM